MIGSLLTRCCLRRMNLCHDPSTSNVPESEATVSEPVSAANYSVVDSSSWMDVSDQDRTASWVCDQSCHAEVGSVDCAPSPKVDDLSTNAVALPLPSPVPLSHAPPLTDTLPQGSKNSVRPRHGRVVRPLRRLIETMVQFTPRFSVAPQSTFVLF